MAQKLNRGDKITCWKCGQIQEDVVEDYVIPGKVGIESETEEDCHHCGAYFTVVCSAPDQYEVFAV
jgi:hypothetical protein